MVNRVARYQADRTNQKFYFCRIYCQLAEKTPIGQLQDAHIESAMMHLYFLADIETAWQQILYKPVPQAIENSTNHHQKLPIIDIMAAPQGLGVSVDMIRQWRLDLVEIIDSLREGMIEF